MSYPDEWTPEERDRYQEFTARIAGRVEERLAEYRRRDVYVYDLFIHPDDKSHDAPELWLACDHYTGEEIQTLAAEDLPAFFAAHPDWIEYHGLLDEAQDEVSDEDV